MSAPGANSSAYCKYDNQGLQAFTSVLFLVRLDIFGPSRPLYKKSYPWRVDAVSTVARLEKRT